MINLLKVFVLLFKFGPEKIIQNIEEDKKDLTTGVYTPSFFLSLAKERASENSSIVCFEVLPNASQKKPTEDRLRFLASSIKKKAGTDLVAHRGKGSFLLLLKRDYSSALRLAREIAGEDMNFMVYPFNEISREVLLKAEEGFYLKKIFQSHG